MEKAGWHNLTYGCFNRLFIILWGENSNTLYIIFTMFNIWHYSSKHLDWVYNNNKKIIKIYQKTNKLKIQISHILYF